jgi:hypothetical protein
MISRSRLESAVERGIITQAQFDAIVQLAPDDGVAAREAKRGFNAVTIAYAAGAIAVLFAFAWFLFERWSVLGAGGVLAIVLGYTALFVAAAHFLGRYGFRTASSIAVLLAVGMTPVITWALLALVGFWPDRPALNPATAPPPIVVANSARWLPIELATAVAAALVLSRVRFGLLTLPIAVAFSYFALHLVPLLFDPSIALWINPWMGLLAGCLLLLAAYAVDQRQGSEEDYARWLYVTALVDIVFALGGIWSTYPHGTPHIVALLSVLAVAASLYLRRLIFLFFGALGATAYLAYLAFDVFRRTVAFSVVLAGFGLALILLTVWLQRRYPALARRIDEERRGRRPTIPGGHVIFTVASIAALVLLITAPPRARRAQLEQDERSRRLVEQLRRDSVSVRRDSIPTPPPRR